MIAHMDQITVIGRKGIAHDLLSALQSLGVVHIDPLESNEEDIGRYTLEGEDKALKESWNAIVSRSSSLIDVFAAGGVKAAARSDIPSAVEDLEQYLVTVSKQADELVAERADLKDELDLAETYLPAFRELTTTLASFDDSRYLHASSLSIPADKFEDLQASLTDGLEDSVELISQPKGDDLIVTAIGLQKDRDALRAAISRAGFAEITLPERYADLGVAKAVHTMEERQQSVPKRLEVIETELAKLGSQHGAKLQAISQNAANQQARYSRLEDLAATRYGIALRGWMPSSERTKVVEGIKKQFGEDIVVETRAADDHHDHNVPVKLDNPGWVKPFEGLLSLFAPPKYGAFDPSWTLAVFFPFFFGLVVGDIGFGLMFASLAWWMRRRGAQGKELSLGILGVVINPKALAPISTVIFWCSAWSVLFGVLFGEFFGNVLEKIPAGKPIFYTTLHHDPGYGIFNIALFRVEVFTPLLLISIGFGILQVIGGWVIRVIFALRHKHMSHVYEGIGMVSGLSALVIFAWAYLTNAINPFVNILVIVGLVVFLVCTVLARVPLMLVELVSNGGAILSYLRLFAVGLSAAIVANLATGLGFAVGESLPIIGPILGIIVAAAVHLLAMALTIIGHALQPLRLHYVEFFTKFGFYDENGRAYEPFRLLGGKA